MSEEKNTLKNFVAPPKTSAVWSDKIFSGIDAYIEKNYVPDAAPDVAPSGINTNKTEKTAADAPKKAKRGFFGFHGISYRPKRKETSEARYDDSEPRSDDARTFDGLADAEALFEEVFDGAEASEDAITAMPEELPEEADLEDLSCEATAKHEEKISHASAYMGAGKNGMAAHSAATPKRSLEELMNHVSDTWQESLLHLIDSKGYTDTEVYKRANLDRKLFSKIRSNAHYQPKKNTAVALALALHLNLDETKDLLGRAGYALSPSSKFDLIISYFIENEVYDLYTINLALFDHEQPVFE